jgi:large subunit ribosomal protein L35
MPKMKTHSGAKKRFSVTRTGKVQSRAAAKRHRLTSKSKRMKHEGRATHILKDMNAKVILDYFFPYQLKLRRNNPKRQRKTAQEKALGKKAGSMKKEVA